MVSNIKITFLGTSDAVPTVSRNHTGILLNYFGENILVDCGEGIQRQFRKAGLNPCKITKILITHWHGDHVLGIPGLLQTLSLSGYNKKLEIYGPKGFKKKLKKTLESFYFDNKIDFVIKEVKGNFVDTEDYSLFAEKMFHRIECNAYCFIEKDKIKIDKSKLDKEELTEGPHIKDLKKGKNIKFKGKKYKAKDLTFIEKGKKICFVLDTRFDKKIPKFVKNSDLLVCEAGFSSDLEEHAEQYRHLTAEQAGKIAKQAKAKKLVLTHISQRYEQTPKVILDEAKKNFEKSFIAKDFDVFEI